MSKSKRVINLQFHNLCLITTEEYDAIKRDLEMRAIVDSPQPGDHILACLLVNMEWRYHEIKMFEKHEKCDKQTCPECR